MTAPTPRSRKPLPPVSRGVSFSSDAAGGSARPASAAGSASALASAAVPEHAPVFPRVHEGAVFDSNSPAAAAAAMQDGGDDEPEAPPADDDGADESTLRSRKSGRLSVVYV